MTEKQIHQLIKQGNLPESQVCQKLIQTHISWVLLCRDYVYKIKKPVKLSFLDFSTFAKREYYCQQELQLNQRLTRNMYLDLYPILRDHDDYYLGSGKGKIIDYCVVMRRLDNSKEMSKLLRQGKVSKTDMEEISGQLVRFHQAAEIISGKFTPALLAEDFDDIKQIQSFVSENINHESAKQLREIVSFAAGYIEEESCLISQRDVDGFTRDCHGDLHSGNIFLLDHPVVFDCIEFNEHFRQIDILSELAFFCMDLEIFERNDLSDYFLECYNKVFPVIRNKREERLFLFYKLYRANVKIKINAMKTQQASNPAVRQSRLEACKKYYKLFCKYYELLAV